MRNVWVLGFQDFKTSTHRKCIADPRLRGDDERVIESRCALSTGNQRRKRFSRSFIAGTPWRSKMWVTGTMSLSTF